MSDSDSDSSSSEHEYIPNSSTSSPSEDEQEGSFSSSDTEAEPETGYQVTPYAHEPMYTDEELAAMELAAEPVSSELNRAEASASSLPEEATEPAAVAPAITVQEFCKCGKCVAMPKTEENVCCYPKNTTEFACVTANPQFEGCVLCEMTLETAAMHQDFQQIGRRDFSGFRLENNVYRYLAYRQATYALHRAPLGRGNRVPLPACVVHAILGKFPLNPGEDRVGFLPSVHQSRTALE